MTDVRLVIGPPGTGKSSHLAQEAEQAGAEYGAADVAICSLTRTAAKEIAGRTDVPDDNVGTLHAHAFRALDRPDLAETPEGLRAWGEAHPELKLTGGRGSVDDLDAPSALDEGGRTHADDLHQQVMNHRARLTPREAWSTAERDYATRWDDFKAQTERLDFTDLIEQALTGTDCHPAQPRTLLGDEGQDFSTLELALFRHWARATDRAVVAADPLQCQPAGTMVSTREGPIPIEHLDPTTHKLLSYCRHDNLVYGHQRGDYPFEVARRPFIGEMTTATTVSGERSSYTPNHRCYIRWKGDCQLICTYLMRQGDRWRIGWCQLFKKDSGSLHLAHRAILDRADDVWVLKLHRDRGEASADESALAAQYGIPLICFEPKPGNTYQTPPWISSVYAALDPDEQRDRAHRLLHDHSRSPAYPLWAAADPMVKQGKRHRPMVRACNLLPEAMLLPTNRNGAKLDWKEFDVDRAVESRVVYSLDVKPYHSYVADGIATANSIYQWRGADPHAFDRIDAAHTRVLRQSHRLSRAVHAAAVGWAAGHGLRPPVYRPRDVAGAAAASPVALCHLEPMIDELRHQVDAGETVMVLASCGYMLTPAIRALKTAGIPFHNPLRPERGAWNPLRGAGRLAAFLRPDEAVWGERARPWTWSDLRAWTEPLSAKDALARGAKALIDEKCREDKLGGTRANVEVDLDTLASLLGAETPRLLFNHPAVRGDVGWWERNLRASKRDAMRYPLQVLATNGGRALLQRPKVTVGTIHSVKGGEADRVVLAPDLSKAAMYHGWMPGGPGRDHIVRTFYVGLTRARERVTVLSPSAAEHVDVRALVGDTEAVAA